MKILLSLLLFALGASAQAPYVRNLFTTSAVPDVVYSRLLTASAQMTNVLSLNTASNIISAFSNITDNTVVRMAQGTYNLKASITGSNGLSAINLFNKRNIRIEGAGMGLTVLYGTNLGGVLLFTNVDGLTLCDLTVRGWVETNYMLFTNCYGWGGVGVFNVQNAVIERVGFENHHDHGIYDRADGSTPVMPYSTNNFRVRDCYFDNIGSWRNECPSLDHDGTACPGGGWVVENCYFVNCMRAFEPYALGVQILTDSTIRGNVVRNTIEHCLTTAGNTNQNRLLIENNLFIWDKGYQRRGTNPLPASAVFISGGQRNVLRNNTIVNVPGVGIVFDGSVEQIGSIIENNVVRGQFNDADFVQGMSFYNGDVGVYNFREFVIRNNVFDGLTSYGLTLAVMRDSQATGNSFINCGYGNLTSVRIYTTAGHVVSNVVFSGNNIVFDGITGGSVTSGLDIDAQALAITLTGNTIQGPTTPIDNAAGLQVRYMQQFDYATGTMRNDFTNSFNALAIGPSGVSVTNVLSASAALNFAAQTLGSFEDLPITVTGAAAGDAVTVVVPQASATDIIGTFSGYASNNTVYVRFLSSGTAQNPASGTFKVLVQKW